MFEGSKKDRVLGVVIETATVKELTQLGKAVSAVLLKKGDAVEIKKEFPTYFTCKTISGKVAMISKDNLRIYRSEYASK